MKELKTKTGNTCKIDAVFYPMLSQLTWYYKNGYFCTFLKGKDILIHRLLMGAKEGEIIDHINGDKLDNRLANLRVASASQNNQNKVVKSKTGFKGVVSVGNKFKSMIRFNRKNYRLGSFNTVFEAAFAYDKKAIELYGEHAATNYSLMKDYMVKMEEYVKKARNKVQGRSCKKTEDS